ncbi:hypothetical protein EV193_102119 [Herbihabitans rhizosphaerae]|uniref:FecCD transport family protein n=1 Tax=Herbihabitans rhizosphaerae TaxID=1872711 RepID=A0A4V2EU30_9PSEU|nr:hypothetical protein EV193_102119 [Herbihabitans rhizosphaerae]
MLLALALMFVGLCHGSTWSTPSEVLAAIVGRGEETFVIMQWRLPRVAAALVFGRGAGTGRRGAPGPDPQPRSAART